MGAITRSDLELLVVDEELQNPAQSLQEIIPNLTVTTYHMASVGERKAMTVPNFYDVDTIFFTFTTNLSRTRAVEN